jgi:hypothetical protein
MPFISHTRLRSSDFIFPTRRSLLWPAERKRTCGEEVPLEADKFNDERRTHPSLSPPPPRHHRHVIHCLRNSDSNERLV